MTAATLGEQAAGLVVILDAAGRTIAGLEAEVDQLNTHVRQLETANADLRRQLAAARAAGDPADVRPPGTHSADDEAHDLAVDQPPHG